MFGWLPKAALPTRAAHAVWGPLSHAHLAAENQNMSIALQRIGNINMVVDRRYGKGCLVSEIRIPDDGGWSSTFGHLERLGQE